MADELPSEYDAIVIGTGVPESILAAALARIGQGVLHIDRNDYYGSDWATFNFEGLERWLDRNKSPTEDNSDAAEVGDNTNNYEVGEGEFFITMPDKGDTVKNLEVYSFIKETSIKPESEEGDNSLQGRDKTPDPVDQEVGLTTMAETTDDMDGREVLTKEEKQEENKDKIKEKCSEEQLEGSMAAASVVTVETVPSVKESDGSDMKSREENESLKSEKEVSETGVADTEVKGCESCDSKPKEQVIKPQRKEWTMEDIRKEWRRFNIDLAPKILFSRGSLVELLISSNISRYAEFKCVTRILTHLNGKIEQVPCSRSDVFSSKYVSMLEKRMLMKFIEFCLAYEKHPAEYQEFEDRPFVDFLKTRKLTPNLQHFVQHSIAMVTDQTPTLEGLKATHHFLRSLGRYGNTPFLWPLYGSGELPQCFCRMCAVFAGIYVLRRNGKALIIDKQSKLCKGIIDTEGQRLNCRWVIMEGSYVPQQHSKPEVIGCVSRGVFFTNRSLKPGAEDQVTLLTIPPTPGQDPVKVIELNHAAYACPKGMYVVHMTCKGSKTAKEDLKYAVDLLFEPAEEESPSDAEQSGGTETEKPKVLWCMYFTQSDTSECVDEAFTDLPENVLVTSGPGPSIGFEHAVVQAKKLFEKICPGEEFLPAAPNPEDIIYVEDESEKKDVGFEEGTETPDSEEVKGDQVRVEEAKDNSAEVKGEEASVEGEEVKSEESEVKGDEVKGGETSIKDDNEDDTLKHKEAADTDEVKGDMAKVKGDGVKGEEAECSGEDKNDKDDV
ncbi:rab proteins geranylgeranyltransferase component A 2-like isoform X2 [Glandiceps talaboti]